MKKFLLAILIFVLAFCTLAVCCSSFNGQFAYADEAVENDGASDGLDEYGLPVELDAKFIGDFYGEGISYKYGDRRVYLYVVTNNGAPVGVALRGLYFGASNIEVYASVYSSPEFAIDFKINATKSALSEEQLQRRDALIETFGEISKMIDEVDDVANTNYDGDNPVGLKSDIYRYNVAKQGEEIDISRYTYEMLTLAREMYIDTDGAFNPAVYRLVDLWGFSSRIYSYGRFGEQSYDRNTIYALPEQKYIDAFSNPAFTDFSDKAVKLTDHGDGTYSVTKNVAPAVVGGEKFEQWLDLGGVAKGYAVDLARAYIKKLGIDRFYVNAGSSSIVTGDEFDGGKTTLGMQDAFDSASVIFQTALFTVDIGKSSVSTSGQNIRKFTVGGVEYAHILDGVTGAPAQTGIRSVMVIVPEELGQYWATMGDCLTTALTVMGRDKIVDFANGYLKDKGIKFVVQYETLDHRKQLLSNFDQKELTGVAESYLEYGWAMKLDDKGEFYYDANAKFFNPKKTYTVLLASLGSVLGLGAVALVVYHFLRGKKRALTNVVYAKKDKPFKALDVMMYLGVLLVIVVLLAVFVFDIDKTGMQMVTVVDDENGETLFMYNVTRNEYAVNQDNSNGWKIEVDTTDGVVVTMSRVIDGEQHYNKLKITSGTPSVQMIDSVCGYHQDCVRNFPAVTRSGGAIVCSPNRLKIITA